MKRLCLLLAAMILLLAGCQNAAPAPADPAETLAVTEPTDTLQAPEAPTTAPTEAPAEPPTDTVPETEPAKLQPIAPAVYSTPRESEIPIMIMFEDENYMADSYRVLWDLETNTLSEPEYFYSHDDTMGPFITNPLVWTGGPLVTGYADADCAPGITYNKETMIVAYGRSYYNQEDGILLYENEDGVFEEIAFPAVPADVFDTSEHKEPLMTDPIYATKMGDNALVAYLYYETYTTEDGGMEDFGYLIYCVYPTSSPEEGKWTVTYMPYDTHPSVVFGTRDAALLDGALYFPSKYDIVRIDIESGEVSHVDALHIFRELHPDYVDYDPWGFPYYVTIPCVYHDTLVASVVLVGPDGLSHNYLTALKNGEIVAVMEIAGDFLLTFYDSDLNIVGTNDILVDSGFANLTFAQDD